MSTGKYDKFNRSVQPRNRSRLRIYLGRIIFTGCRYGKWLLYRRKYSCEQNVSNILHYSTYKHRAPLIRQLSVVDMWLQYNKIVNLKLATSRINGLILQPGKTFSFWRMLGKPSGIKGYLK